MKLDAHVCRGPFVNPYLERDEYVLSYLPDKCSENERCAAWPVSFSYAVDRAARPTQQMFS